MNEFRMEDVRIDTFSYGMYGKDKFRPHEGYRMVHKPTGVSIMAIGNPHVSPADKELMIKTLKKQVDKFVAKNQSKEKP